MKFHIPFSILFISILLLLNVGLGHEFDFEKSKTLVTASIEESPKAFWNAYENRWELMYTDSSDDIWGRSFSPSFVELASTSETCGADECEYVDCNYIIADEKYWICLADEGGGTHDAYIFRFDFNGTGFTTLDSEQRPNDVNAVRVPAVANRYADKDTGNPLLLWDNLYNAVRTDDLRYTIDNEFHGGYPSTYSGDGAFNLPPTYHKPDDVQVAWCNGAYHVLVIKDGGLFDLVYDDEEQLIGDNFDFENPYALTPSFETNVTAENFGVTSIDNILYIAVTGEDGGEYWVNLQAYTCNDDFTITQVYNKDIKQEEIRKIDSNFYSSNDAVLVMPMEDSTSPINDDSGFNNDGVYNGGSFQQSGKYKYGLGFNGTNEFINITHSSSLNINDNSITLETLVKFNSLPVNNAYQEIFYKHESNKGYRLVFCQEYSEYRIKFIINGGNYYVTWANPQVDTWYHIVGVYDGSNLKVFIDGSQVGNSSAYSSAIETTNNNLYIGSSGSSHYLNGYLDETVIYDDALSPSEITTRYNFFYGQIKKPYLTKNSDGIYYLFYEDVTPTNHYLKVSYENPCFCSVWVNTTTCVEDRILQTRNCHPDLCDDEDEERYVESIYCQKEFNRTQGIYTQRTETFQDQSSCETDWFDVGSGIAECYPLPLEIPIDCVNIHTWIEAIPVFDAFNDKGCSEGLYHLTTCNPTYECFNQNYTCEQMNVSQKDYHYGYTIGDTATAKASLSVDNACRCEWAFWDYGIKRFKLRASLYLRCDRPCQEEWICINTEYKALKHIDCSISNTTLCEYGCSNGICSGITDDDSPYSTKSIWDNLFKPSRTTKFFYSLSGSAIIGIALLAVGNSFDKHNRNGGILFMLGFGIGFAFFTLIAWIPAPIIFIIIFFGGAYALFKNLK